jgi:hypothetical protein
MKPFVNPVDMKIPVSKVNNARWIPRDDIDRGAFIMEDLLTKDESAYIMDFLEQTAWQPVSVTGMQGNYEPGDPIGSWRASSFQEEYAQVLFDRLINFIPERKVCNDSTNTDWDNHTVWEPIGVNPLLRFIKYTDGGYLVPHYDASYVASDEERTLASLVIYLDRDPSVTGGAVQFLEDPQAHLPVTMRNLDDLTTPAKEEDVRISLHPKPASALVFDHRILHESQKVVGNGQKTIIRTDIMYRKVH